MMHDLDPFERRAIRAALNRHRRYIDRDIERAARNFGEGSTEHKIHQRRLDTLESLLMKITEPSSSEVMAAMVEHTRQAARA